MLSLKTVPVHKSCIPVLPRYISCKLDFGRRLHLLLSEPIVIRLRLKPEAFFGHSCYYKENFQTFKRRTVKSGYTKLASKKEKTFSEGENVGQGEVYRERIVERKERVEEENIPRDKQITTTYHCELTWSAILTKYSGVNSKALGNCCTI